MDQFIKIASLALGSVFSIFMGVRIYLGTPFDNPFRTYRSMSPETLDWLIDTLGEAAIAVVFIAVGVLLAVLLVRSLRGR